MNTGSLIYEIRRANLATLINARFEGNRAAFCRTTGKHPNLINLLLSSNPTFARRMGERLARDIERTLDLAPGWFDTQQSEPVASGLIHVPVVSLDALLPQPTPGGEVLTLRADVLRGRLSAFTAASKLRAVYVDGQGPSSKAQVGDVLLVDLGAQTVDRDAAYVLGIAGSHLVRRVRRGVLGEVLISVGDERADETELTPARAKSILVVARVVGVLTFLPL